MKIATKRALYSGLILPGWGQLANKQKVKGGIFIALSLFILCGFLIHIGIAFIDYAKALGNLADPEAFQSTKEIMTSFFKQLLFALLLWMPIGLIVWIGSAVDAYVSAIKLVGDARDEDTVSQSSE